MNNMGVWREIMRGNRGTVITMSVISIVLFMVLIVVMNINNENNARIESIRNGEEEVKELVEKEEAEDSSQNLDLYINDIKAVINNAYGVNLEGYEIARGRLLDDGTWYVTTIAEPKEDQWSLPEDTYRVVLQKNSDAWRIVAGPSLYFSYDEYPDIPVGVLVAANNL